MKNIIFVIIEQQYSDGKIIAQKLSKELKIPLYDKEIINLASKNSNINKNIFYTIENCSLNKFIPPFSTDFYTGFSLAFFNDFVPIQDKVFTEKSKVIKQLVKDKSCVIFSKGSNYILKDFKNCIKVLIYSKDEKRLLNIQPQLNLSLKKSKKFLKKQDKNLSNYYGYFTCDNWDNKKNYDIFLNSSYLDEDACVNILKSLFEYLKQN